jgi:hypothetical protein
VARPTSSGGGGGGKRHKADVTVKTKWSQEKKEKLALGQAVSDFKRHYEGKDFLKAFVAKKFGPEKLDLWHMRCSRARKYYSQVSM